MSPMLNPISLAMVYWQNNITRTRSLGMAVIGLSRKAHKVWRNLVVWSGRACPHASSGTPEVFLCVNDADNYVSGIL